MKRRPGASNVMMGAIHKSRSGGYGCGSKDTPVRKRLHVAERVHYLTGDLTYGVFLPRDIPLKCNCLKPIAAGDQGPPTKAADLAAEAAWLPTGFANKFGRTAVTSRGGVNLTYMRR